MLHNRDLISKNIQVGTVGSDGNVYLNGVAVCAAPSGSEEGDSVTVTKVNGVVVANKR